MQSSVTNEAKHICICICTYKRPDLLKRLLEGIAKQKTNGDFSYSVVVVDNDEMQSAMPVVDSFQDLGTASITYCVEPCQNIARARNKAVKEANGDFIAFIDDDEFPVSDWLQTLFVACTTRNVAGVLGPVKPHFDVSPPSWVVEGKFYERASYPTGLVIDWRKGRTGNVLLRREVFADTDEPFKPQFRNGEDQEFFHRMIEKGHVFIWCDEAVAYEVVPPIRWQKTFMLRRALLRGSIEPQTPNFGVRDVVKSLIAVPIYLIALPFSRVFGESRFMSIMIRICDHLGKLLAVVGLNPVKEQYVTE